MVHGTQAANKVCFQELKLFAAKVFGVPLDPELKEQAPELPAPPSAPALKITVDERGYALPFNPEELRGHQSYKVAMRTYITWHWGK